MSNTTLTLTQAQTVPLGIFTFLATVCGITGNLTVLYASLRNNAIQLDKASLVYVQHLAAADVMYIFCTILPNFVTYTAGEWVLGSGYCFVSAQLSFVPGLVNIMLVLLITFNRLVVLTIPFHATRKTTARICAALCWSIAVLVPGIVHGYYRTKGVFNPDIGVCTSTLYVLEDSRVALMVFTALLVLLPLLLITIANMALSAIAVKHSTYIRSLREQVSQSTLRSRTLATQQESSTGVDVLRSKQKGLLRSNTPSSQSRREGVYKSLLMTCLLSGMFVVSWLPYIIYNLVKIRIPDVPSQFEILAFHCIYVNSFGNPILYSLTNKSFGRYVLRVAGEALCPKRRYTSITQLNRRGMTGI